MKNENKKERKRALTKVYHTFAYRYGEFSDKGIVELYVMYLFFY